MKPNAPIKSAFLPMKPRIDPSLLRPKDPPPEPSPATPTQAKPQKPKGPAQPPPQPLPAEVLLLAELCERDDRENIPAWGALVRDRERNRAAVILCFNRTNWLMQRALKSADYKLVKYLAALALAEFFYLRRNTLTQAIHDTLRASLVPPELSNVHGVFFTAGMLLDSPPWQSIEKIPLYAADAPLGERHLVARVVLSKAADAQNASDALKF
jgi:hypothetical protein